MKWFLIALAAPVLALAIVAMVGALLPRQHVATRTIALRRSAGEVYALVRDVAAAPAWRTGVKRVELLPAREGRALFRETGAHGAITYCVVAERPGEQFITAIADEHLPFGGSWTYDFVARPAGSELRITEHGEVKNVIFRCLGRFVFGYEATMETYLRDVARKLGGAAEPRP
jgi:hypothetical protein